MKWIKNCRVVFLLRAVVALVLVFADIAAASELDIPSYHNSPIKAHFQIGDSGGRFEASIELLNHDQNKSYTVNVYDSSSCSDLNRKILIYAKSNQGYRLINDMKNYDLLTIEAGPRAAMGIFKVGNTGETLYNSVKAKVVAVRESGGEVVACGVLP
jgi:hypothetical protein